MKLILKFRAGQYSSLKDSFKTLYAGQNKFRWVSVKDGWFGKDGYVKSTQKMEPGAAMTFLVECDEVLMRKFIGYDELQNNVMVHVPGFCDTNKIQYEKVDNFDNVVPPKVQPGVEQQPATPADAPARTMYAVKPLQSTPEIKLDRELNFIFEMTGKPGLYSEKFKTHWAELLREDDRTFNNPVKPSEPDKLTKIQSEESANASDEVHN